jgi:hypothetical protein
MIFERLYGARTPLQQRPSVISKPSIRREQIEFYHYRHYHALLPIRRKGLPILSLRFLRWGTISAGAPKHRRLGKVLAFLRHARPSVRALSDGGLLIALTLIIQEREGARIQADLLYRKFDFGSCNSLFFEINSLIRRKNSLFRFAGNLALSD